MKGRLSSYQEKVEVQIMQIELIDNEAAEPLTPAWHYARNLGVSVAEVVKTLKSRGVHVVLDSDARPAFRKSDLYALVRGERG